MIDENKRWRRALSAIKTEYDSAVTKFGSFHNAHEGYAVLLEEVDELWEAVKLNQNNSNRELRLYKESVQVGAMALRFIVDCCMSFYDGSEEKENEDR